MYNSVEITSKDLKKPDLLAVTFLNLTTPQIRLATAVEKIMKTSSSFCVNQLQNIFSVKWAISTRAPMIGLEYTGKAGIN